MAFESIPIDTTKPILESMIEQATHYEELTDKKFEEVLVAYGNPDAGEVLREMIDCTTHRFLRNNNNWWITKIKK